MDTFAPLGYVAAVITSRQNPRLRDRAKLRDRRERDTQRLMLIDGEREILRALRAGVTPVEVWTADGPARESEIALAARQAGADLWVAGDGAMERLAYREGAEIVVVARVPDRTLAALRLPSRPLVLVCVGLEKPGNLGAILRTADGAGCDAVVVADEGVDLWNPNVIRASTGAVFAPGVAVGSGPEVLSWLARQGIRLFAATPSAGATLWEADLALPVALAVGTEDAGLDPAWIRAASGTVGIPMLGEADSLNVSVAAALLLYEARRQSTSFAQARRA